MTKDFAKNHITITQEIAGRWVPGKRLNYLLRRPLSGRMFSYVEVDNFTATMFEYEKDVQDSACHRRHGEEVD